MPATRDDDVVRRSLVPPRAARSIWAAAVWTGAGTAVVAAIVAIAIVAVLWLPAAGSAGNASSAIHAGLLTFLAGVHGGVTVDGLAADFVPLGLTLAVAALAWRAGAGLADAADDLDEREPRRLLGAVGLQAAVFAVVCAVAGRLATLGTSSVPPFGVTLAALVLFGLVAGAALVRWSPLGDDLVDVLPAGAWAAVRAGVAVVAVYLIGGALLGAGSVAAHHARVEQLSAQVGGGLSGVPVLLLGVLAAPNAAIAGATYLAGPGFAVGSGHTISLWSGARGVVPSFPILGGLPAGPAGAATWVLAVLTVLAAGLSAAALLFGIETWAGRAIGLGRAAGVAGLVAVLLSWQGGGAIGSGHLSAVGASPWQAGLAFAAVTLVGGGVGLAALAAAAWGRAHRPAAAPIRALAERTTAASSALTDALESAHSVVAVEAQGKGILRATLRSVAAAVTTTEAERQKTTPTQRPAADPAPAEAVRTDEPAEPVHAEPAAAVAARTDPAAEVAAATAEETTAPIPRVTGTGTDRRVG